MAEADSTWPSAQADANAHADGANSRVACPIALSFRLKNCSKLRTVLSQTIVGRVEEIENAADRGSMHKQTVRDVVHAARETANPIVGGRDKYDG